MEADLVQQLKTENEKLKKERDEALAKLSSLSLKVEDKKPLQFRDTDNNNIILSSRVPIKQILHSPQLGLEYADKTVQVAGWARSIREQGGGRFSFIVLNDGSCAASLQIVVVSGKEGYEDITGKNSGTGACILAIGKIVKSTGAKQAVEMQADKVVLLGACVPGDYPLAKSFIPLEKLREIAHLRARTNTIGAMARVRNACAFATHKFFQEEGFMYVNTPLITASDCEGAGEMFQITTLLQNGTAKLADVPVVKETGKPDYTHDFFGKPAFLTVSGQLNGEMYATALGRIYTFGPTFRAEVSHTPRHMAEFWMIEPEISFADLNDNMDIAESYLKYVIKFVMDNNMEDLEIFEALEKREKEAKQKEQKEKEKQEKQEKGKKKEKQQAEKYEDDTPLIARLQKIVATPFKRLTYTEAVDVLINCGKEFLVKVEWGIDLGSEHERYLTEQVFKQPIILTDYPKEIKAFYMRLSEDGKTVRAMDVLVPKIGEIIGGSQREERLEVLEQRIEQLKLDKEAYRYYLDLRRFGTVVHSGFGLGFERLIMLVTGLENIRDAIPFPRWPGHAEF